MDWSGLEWSESIGRMTPGFSRKGLLLERFSEKKTEKTAEGRATQLFHCAMKIEMKKATATLCGLL